MNKSTVSFLRRLTVFAGAAACVLAQGSGCGTQLFVTDAGANATDMRYNLGVAPSTGGCANIFFVPNANNNYNRTAT